MDSPATRSNGPSEETREREMRMCEILRRTANIEECLDDPSKEIMNGQTKRNEKERERERNRALHWTHEHDGGIAIS
jgi:hypothetical protein